MSNIHPTAVVDAQACIDATATVGPYAVIGPHVSIGAGTTVGPHCVIEGRTTIGQDNRIFQFVSLGAAPQDKKYAGEPTELRIGDRNTFREFCTINTGTVQDRGVTTVGNDNWVMAYVHIAHDCVVGDFVTLAPGVQCNGNVVIEDHAYIGAGAVIKQGQPGKPLVIGSGAMVGMGAVVTKSIPPGITVVGNPARPLQR